jgi:3-isopropylmalate dehydrogenase
MGLLPSASVGSKTSLYEPIHGSYPQATGLDIANPMATILSAAMMLDYFGLHKEADLIRESVTQLLESGYGTAELQLANNCKCSEIGDMIAAKITAS